MISIHAVQAITDPDTAQQVARDLAAFTQFAEAHADYCRHVTYQLAGTEDARRRSEDARLLAPEFVNVAGVVTGLR